ncbi:MAG: N-acetylmuramoyl-L-alanine amidase [Pseudomonadota bacterium]
MPELDITFQSSPNFNDRKADVSLLVLHYTGMETGQAALERMCNPAAEVSAHYMVWEDGRIVQLVGEDKRAWHAGVSSWRGQTDLNSRSIGLEIVNGGHDWPLEDGTLPPYPDVQIKAVIDLCQGILQRWPIPQTGIVGHSDIAPDRKDDPGEHFPWQSLAGAGIGLWPEIAASEVLNLIGRGLGRSDKGEAVSRLQRILSDIGYEIKQDGVFGASMEAVIRAFQRRWVPDQVSGVADLSTLRMIAAVDELHANQN